MSETTAEILSAREAAGFPSIRDQGTLGPLMKLALSMGEDGASLLRYLHDADALIAHVERLTEERETEAKRWAEYLDWLSWIADCANDPNYGSEAERLAKIAEAVADQEKKETPPFVEFIWDRMLAAETKAGQAEAQLAEAAEWLATCRKYLRRKRSLSPAFYAQMKRLDTFLVGLSTTPGCERVSVCPGTPQLHDCKHFICATHHGPWPSDTKRCPATVPPLLTKGLREDGQ